MASTRHTTADTPTGTGVVYQMGKPIATVTYTVIVRQGISNAGARDGTGERDGLPDSEGLLTVLRGDRELMENPGPFVLEFEDGKLMEFVVTQYDPVADLCYIVGG